MTNYQCESKRGDNPQLRTIKCCRKCHASDTKLELDSKVAAKVGDGGDARYCCKVWHYLTQYKPSTRADNPLKS